MIALLRRLAARVRNRRFDENLAEELRFHEEMKRPELQVSGVAPEEATTAARRALVTAFGTASVLTAMAVMFVGAVAACTLAASRALRLDVTTAPKAN